MKDGHVVVFRDAVGKPLQLLARLGPLDFFGELALFHEMPSTISARATETSRIFKISREALLAFLEEHPAVALRLQMAAARRHSINAAAALELGQRNEVRIRISRQVELFFEDGSSRTALLDNLSPGGLCLRGAPGDWRENDLVHFQLRYGKGVLPCSGRITWVHAELTGIAFIDSSHDHERKVRQSLRQLLT